MKAFLFEHRKIIAVLLGIIVIGALYYYFSQEEEVPVPRTTNYVQIPNKIITVYKIELSIPEKDQVMRSVDAFMDEYKLPHGDFQNTYTLSVERRINDVLMVTTDPEQPKNDAHATIYLRKVDGTWTVDPSGGPWCTLEEFEQYDCEQEGNGTP